MRLMTDHTEPGAVPAEDASANDPTVDEVLHRQRLYPERAQSPTHQRVQPESAAGEEIAAAKAGGDPTGSWTDGIPDIEGPNSA